MKKITLTLIALLGLTAEMKAQETDTIATQNFHHRKDRPNFYYGIGVNVLGDYKINDKLKASGMPKIANTALEGTFGFNVNPSDSHFYNDVEVALAYMDDKTTTNRIKTVATNIRLRVHYKVIDNKKLFLSGGLDLGYAQTYVNLYSRGNRIDLNDLDPATHTGHIALRNGQLTLGPSVALGLFQDDFPIRINAGYNIGVTRGKWKSDFAEIDNTVNESGLGSFYAKVSIGF